MERVTEGLARWFLKCHKCRKPWAVELPHVKVREISGFDLPEYPGGPRKARYTLRDDYGPVTVESEKACPLCGTVPPAPYRHGIMGRVQGRRLRLEDLAPKCDGRCTNAKGPSCDCLCQGENHGTQRLVARPVDCGLAPAV